jgi:hypothetical protein
MDNITIGSLVSEKWLEKTAVIQGPSFGLLYNFVWRFDKTAQDVGIFNMGLDDNSNVYQLVRPGYDFSGATVVIDLDHAKVHCGYHFFQAGVFELASGASMNVVVEVNERRPHMVFTISSTTAGFTVLTREGITANEDGTLLPILNNNRSHTNGNTTILRLNPTGVNTTGSIIIREARLGTTGGGNAEGGNINRGNEIIMKADTKYLLTITNLGAQVNHINLMHEWYEVNY